MNKPSLSTLLFSGFLALVLLTGSVTPVSAIAQTNSPQISPNSGISHRPPHPIHRHWVRLQTDIIFSQPADTNLSGVYTLSGIIKDQFGRPVSGKTILFTINGEFLGQTRSDEYGRFGRKFKTVLDAGTYFITATSKKTHFLDQSIASTTLKILPAEVQVQTVPPIAGIPFQLNGTQFVSDEKGMATIMIGKAGQFTLEVLTNQYHSSAQQIEFARWMDESYQPFKNIQVPTNKVIQVGFNVNHQVGQSFVDLDGFPVDPQRVTELTIRSAQGDLFVLHDGQPRWIPASRVAHRSTGLEETPLLYSILSVKVDGSNVVNQSQQRFFTFPTNNWPISLLLYSMSISAKDGLFGSPIGKSVNVQFPDGHVVNYPLDQAGTVEIHSLARGNYVAELVGVSGLSSRTPIALSRSQVLNAKVITYLDLTIVGLLGASIALGLLFYGRPSLLHILPKNNKSTTQEEGWVVDPQTLPEKTGQLYDYRRMRYETVKLLEDEDFKNSTGVDRDIFEKMLALYKKEFGKASKQSKLSGADQILLTLLVLREHRPEFEVGQIYGISETTVRRTIKRVKNAMMKSVEFSLSEDAESQSGKALIKADLRGNTEQTNSGIVE